MVQSKAQTKVTLVIPYRIVCTTLTFFSNQQRWVGAYEKSFKLINIRETSPVKSWAFSVFWPEDMISLADIYQVLLATVPLYTTMILAYISVKRWKLFTPDQCSGINKFVANFSVPLLSFRVISTNNPYHMNLKLILADFLQKLLALLVSGVIIKVSSRGSLDWLITGFSLATLPNTLILGIPLLQAMYGDEGAKLLPQIVVLQSAVWYSLLLFLFELRAAATNMATQPSETTGKYSCLRFQ